MTTIKPPNGRSVSDALGSTGEGPQGPAASGRSTGPSFREVLGASTNEAAGASQAGDIAQASADPAALAQAVRSGQLTPEQAVDRLVERAVANAGGSAGTLSPSQQVELRGLLLEAVQIDPALSELREVLK